MRWLYRNHQRRERRRRARLTIQEAGLIVLPETQESRGCDLCDISQDGAGLVLGSDAPLAPEVTLVLPEKRLTTRARLVWQEGTRAGLAFQAGP